MSRKNPPSEIYFHVRTGEQSTAAYVAQHVPTHALYTTRRDLVRAVEIITDELERRHYAAKLAPTIEPQ